MFSTDGGKACLHTHACVGQRTNCRSQLFPSTMWVQGIEEIKIRSSGLVPKGPYPLSYLTSPFSVLYAYALLYRYIFVCIMYMCVCMRVQVYGGVFNGCVHACVHSYVLVYFVCARVCTHACTGIWWCVSDLLKLELVAGGCEPP